MPRKPKSPPPHVIHDSCFNCRFWRRLDDSEQIPEEDVIGECRRNPPTVIALDMGSDEPVQALPEVEARFCCGEHKRPMN